MHESREPSVESMTVERLQQLEHLQNLQQLQRQKQLRVQCQGNAVNGDMEETEDPMLPRKNGKCTIGPREHEQIPKQFPYLTVINTLCMAHVVLAAILPSPGWITKTANIQLSFILFLSAFTLVHSQTHTRSKPYQAQLFYLRRAITIYPLYVLAIITHAVFFSNQTTHIFRRTLFTSILLSPYLPSSFAFPPTDAPFFAHNLIPCLALSYVIFPTAVSLLPARRTLNAHHFFYASLTVYLFTAVQAVWTIYFPHNAKHERATILLDFVFYIPFISHLLPFILGIIVATYQLTVQTTHIPTRLHVMHPLVTTTLLTLCILLCYPLLQTPPMSAILPTWLASGMLLPPFAAVCWSAVTISNPLTTTSSTLLLRMRTHASRYFLTYYFSAPGLYRALSSTVCPSLVTGSSFLRKAICMSPVPLADTPSQGVLQEIIARSFSQTILSHPCLQPAFFIPTSLAFALLVYASLVSPCLIGLLRLSDRLITNLQDERPLTPAMTRLKKAFFTSSDPPYPSRELPHFQRAIRIIAYYIGLASFGIFVFRYSMPITSPFPEQGDQLWTIGCFLPHFLYGCSAEASPADSTNFTFLESASRILRWTSFFALPPTLFNLTGHLLFPRAVWKALPTISQMLIQNQIQPASRRRADCTRFDPVDLNFVIYVRYVTRGNNHNLVVRNVRRAMNVLRESGLPTDMWRVEVVTDRVLDVASAVCGEVCELVVPETYSTTTGARFKARALNFAIEKSGAGASDWIVHLDEETTFDCDTVRGILYHCGRESFRTFVERRQDWPRIGQGPLLYGRMITDGDVLGGDMASGSEDKGNWMTTLADSGRVSDDCGRYRLQFECGEVWVGMHGSYVVACNMVERAVTFNHGAEGSIAEDAFFALVARTKGVRFAWIDALMFEQSPFTLLDFMKQRGRWLIGGVLVVTCKRIALRARWVLAALICMWMCMPLISVVVMLAMLVGDEGKSGYWYFRVLMPALTTLSLWNYVFGFFVTFSVRKLGFVRFWVLFYLQVLLSPVFGAMEVLSSFYAYWNFRKLSTGFHVVQKDIGVDRSQCDSCDNDEVDSNNNNVVFVDDELIPLL